MATKKQSQATKKRLWRLTKSNIFTSIAIVSILGNIFLISILFVASDDNVINRTLIMDMIGQYCSSNNKTTNDDLCAVSSSAKPVQSDVKFNTVR